MSNTTTTAPALDLAAVAQLVARLQASGVTMQQLMNGTDHKPETRPAAPAGNEIFWEEEEYKGTPLFKVCRPFVKQGVRKIDWLFNAGATKWGQLLGTDKDGDSLLMSLVSFLQDHHGDFASVTKDLDLFVKAYLAFRADYYETDNSDLLGDRTAPAPAACEVEVEQEQADEAPSDYEVILSSDAFARLGGKDASAAIKLAIASDFDSQGVAAEDYVAAMAEFAEYGDVCTFLGESGMPSEEGRLVPHAADAPRGYSARAAAAWRKLALAQQPALAAAAAVAQPEAVAVKTRPAVTDGMRRQWGRELSKLPIWKTGTEQQRARLVEEVCEQVLKGHTWTAIRQALSRFVSIEATFVTK